MTCYHSPNSGEFGYGTTRRRSSCVLGMLYAAILALASPAEAGSITPTDCFTRTDQGVCTGIEFSQAEALFGQPTTRTTASTGHPHTAAIDQGAAAAAVGFSTPPFGLDSATPLFASAETSPKTSAPTESYRIEQRGGAVIDATLPAGATAEYQTANWGSTFDTTLLFSGPGATVDVQLFYTADARMSAPAGAKDRTASGILNLVGALLLRESESPAAPPVTEYYGEFIFLPSHPTHPATASNQWTPEEVTELGQQDTIDVDEELEEAALSVSDEWTISVATGTSYDLEGFFSGGATGEIYVDPAQGGQLRWGTVGEATAVIDLRILTPGALLVAAVPIPEATAAAALVVGLGIAASRRGVRMTPIRRG